MQAEIPSILLDKSGRVNLSTVGRLKGTLLAENKLLQSFNLLLLKFLEILDYKVINRSINNVVV